MRMIDTTTAFEKYVLPLLIAGYAILSPALTWFYIVGFFILADFAVKSLLVIRDDKDQFVSSKIWRTVNKLGLSLVFIIAGFVAETYLAKGVPVIKVIASVIIIAELKSLDEKAKIIWGVSFFGFLIDRLTPKK